jgi:pyruvate,water dikinase
MKKRSYIAWFKEIGKNDVSLVGGKGANLGELFNAQVPVPNGFIVTVNAYFEFVNQTGVKEEIKRIIEITNIQNPSELQTASARIKKLIQQTPIPEKIALQIMKAYNKLGSLGGLKQALVAVRSSATAEDLPEASFAGQQETFLNVRGEVNVVNRVRDCWASLFTPRAIFYRGEKKFDQFQVGIAVPVQKMVQSEVSGVMFTINPITNNKKEIIIEAVWGLGETIVQGLATPDHYVIEKDTLKIKEARVSKQTTQLKRERGKNITASVPKAKQRLQKLNSAQIIKLAKLGLKIHQLYFYPQDIEWALEKGQLYIVQTRPVTTIQNDYKEKKNKEGNEERLILKGQGASPGIGEGTVRIISSAKQLSKIKKGDVLVTEMTSPDYVPAMKTAAAIITDKGGQTSHAAIVSRELGIPCVVGTKTATTKLKDGELVRVDGQTGEIYRIEKTLKKKAAVKKKKSQKPVRTATKVYVNLAEPFLASRIAKENVDGVGLLRAEFMIANIGIHPQKLIQEGKQELFIKKLTKDIVKFCKPFSPRPVVYRATDFKTNEYRNLQGGGRFEPKEENPLLGFRGAFRYISTPQVFELELEVIKRVRNKMGLKNLWLMIPFVRTPRELLEVKRVISSAGLARSPSFKLWMMVEIPSNVILLKEFIKVGIDGISIGSNDLTMLTLGLDRDNDEIAGEFDERNKAVLWMIRRTIKTANHYGITSSICGQAPSNYPDLVEKLVRWGITSISVNPDMIESTRDTIHWAEKRVMKGAR